MLQEAAKSQKRSLKTRLNLRISSFVSPHFKYTKKTLIKVSNYVYKLKKNANQKHSLETSSIF